MMDSMIFALAASPNFRQDGLLMAAASDGLRRSDDSGQSWRDGLASFVSDETFSVQSVCYSPDFASDQTIFVGVVGAVLVSADGGESWTAYKLPSPAPIVTTLACSPAFAQDQTVFAGTLDDGIYVSTRAGDVWTGWNYGLVDRSTYALCCSPTFADDEVIFAGVESGMYRSRNGGRLWNELDFPMDFAPVTSIVCGASGRLWAATEENGLYLRAEDDWRRIAPDQIPGGVLGLQPAGEHLYCATEEQILVLEDGGEGWSAVWQPENGEPLQAFTVAEGAGGTVTLFAALSDGTIIRV
ncbi:MAG: hypothetical protein JW750_06910 [Anaerolineaceae bacterium]|nr:hypothetical protein [Anaerolineaceae bacterium]